MLANIVETLSRQRQRTMIEIVLYDNAGLSNQGVVNEIEKRWGLTVSIDYVGEVRSTNAN